MSGLAQEGLLAEVTAWSAEEAGDATGGRKLKLEQLHHQLVQIKKQSPAIYPPGSTQRILAERKEQRLIREAAALGFETPGQALAGHLGMQVSGLEIEPGKG